MALQFFAMASVDYGGKEQEEHLKLVFFQPGVWLYLLLLEPGTEEWPGDTPTGPPAVQLSETDALAGK